MFWSPHDRRVVVTGVGAMICALCVCSSSAAWASSMLAKTVEPTEVEGELGVDTAAESGAAVGAARRVPETRRLGFGSKAGSVGMQVLPFVGPIHALSLPTFEFVHFFKSGNGLQLSVPVVDLIVLSALSRGAAVGATLYWNFYPVRKRFAALVLGPGLGGQFIGARGYIGGSLRATGSVGVELTLVERKFGVSLLAIPFLDLHFTGGIFPAGGMVFAIGVTGYKLKGQKKSRR